MVITGAHSIQFCYQETQIFGRSVLLTRDMHNLNLSGEENFEDTDEKQMLLYSMEEGSHRHEAHAVACEPDPSTSRATEELVDHWKDIDSMFVEATRLEAEIVGKPTDFLINQIQKDKIRNLRDAGNKVQIEFFGFGRTVSVN